MQEAMFWSEVADLKVKCTLCPHECLIPEGKTGICRVRMNRDGKLFSMVFGEPVALHSDPVEKKPLYHFCPGKQILSTGTYGCNLRCSFCQNYHLSQSGPREGSFSHVTPEELVRHAAGIAGNIGMAYTYNEPTVFYEYMLETAQKVKEAGMKNVMVSNGFILPDPLLKLIPHIDAFNIDLKSFRDDFYRQWTGGSLAPVLETLKIITQSGKHLEITHLVIPDLNDSAGDFTDMIGWISENLGKNVPLHLSRYFPAYKMEQPPTPAGTLSQFARLASSTLRYVYTGNMGSGGISSTVCPECRNLLISRHGYDTSVTGLTAEGNCTRCGAAIPVVL
jgi:pyruvate formate lyase activating enzyme